jgi:hypothetical protein
MGVLPQLRADFDPREAATVAQKKIEDIVSSARILLSMSSGGSAGSGIESMQILRFLRRRSARRWRI